ncbi:MAG: flagellar hook-basal body complex protein FliE [Alphaproteobacteria bacterium]|nr:flagellar hook-basal body complex protein FliE [Alphaproteobacteria bacterium]
MSVNPTSVAAAYQKAMASKDAPGADAGDGGAFAKLVGDAMADAVATGKAGEAGIVAGAAGKADMVDVVTAISAAEVTLETVIAVRDRVVAAYQEVMKMPI